jgi:hypothetical protein
MSAAPDKVRNVFDFELPERPYPGLRPFSKSEWPIFYGRERMIDEVNARLIQHRLLVIHGDSGCGKSSLIRAGVLPRLEQEFARGGTGWLTCTTTPGYDPLGNLASALAELDDADVDESRRHEIRRILNCGGQGAASLAEFLCGKRREHVCVLLDQFEELFAHARRQGPQQASILVDLLIGVQKLTDPRLRVVLTMRSEFLGACAQYDGFAQTVNDTQYLLPRMERADLMRAIQEPATLYDGAIAPDLAERLISDARASQDQLPLIQHALMMLHRNRDTKAQKWRLTAEAYPASGGLGSLLSDHADEVARKVEPPNVGGKSVVEEIFRALTEINADRQAIRRPQTVQELLNLTGAELSTLTPILDAFRAEGVSFLRPYGAEPLKPGDSIDISHEALIRCWKKIDDDKDGWLAKEFDDGLIWNSLLVQYKNFKEDPESVLSAATTEERREWLARRNEAWAERYGGGWKRVEQLMAASETAREEQLRAQGKARRAKIWRWGLTVTSIMSILTTYFMITANEERDIARKATAEAEAKGKELGEALYAEAEKREETDAFIKNLQAELAKLNHAAQSAPENSAIQQSIKQANASITQFSNLNQVAVSVAPRIYVHISTESQRKAARIVELGIETTDLGSATVVVPGIQLTKAPPYTLLRCFKAEDCKNWGAKLVELVNAQLISPKVKLQDFSKTYTDTGAIRPLHFELYFAPEEIVPVPGAAKAY